LGESWGIDGETGISWNGVRWLRGNSQRQIGVVMGGPRGAINGRRKRQGGERDRHRAEKGDICM
jgi:hypothetical protein